MFLLVIFLLYSCHLSSGQTMNPDQHVIKVDRMIDSATTMLPETFYQQERNRRLVQAVRAVAAAAAAAGHTNITAVLPTRATVNLRQLRPNRQALNAIHPTDGSVEIDLRELLKKELEERSKLLHPGIATSVSPEISNINQANQHVSSTSSNSGVNLFALLPLNVPDDSSGVSISDATITLNDPKVTSSSVATGNRIVIKNAHGTMSPPPPPSGSASVPALTSGVTGNQNRVKNKKKNTNGHSLAPQSGINPVGLEPSVNHPSNPTNGPFSVVLSSPSVTYTPPRSGIRPSLLRPSVHLLRPGDFVASVAPATSTTPKPSKKVAFVTHVDPPPVTSAPSITRGNRIPIAASVPVRVQSPHLTSQSNDGSSLLPPTVVKVKGQSDWSLRKAAANSKHYEDLLRKNLTAFLSTSTTIASGDTDSSSPSPPSFSSQDIATPGINGNKRATVTSPGPSSASTSMPDLNMTEVIDLRHPIDDTKNDDASNTGGVGGGGHPNVASSPGNSINEDFLGNGSGGDTGAEEGIVNTAVMPAPPGVQDSSDETAINFIPGKKAAGDHSFFPGSSGKTSDSYRLTTERLAYILIGSCCALSILCLVAVAFSIRCRDMCDEYRAWKKAEKLAVYSNLRYNQRAARSKVPPVNQQQQHRQHLSPGHQMISAQQQRLMMNGGGGGIKSSSRPGAMHDPYTLATDSNASLYPSHLSPPSRPIFGPSCCCPAAAAAAAGGHSDTSCPKGYYHPTPRGKLPFGAASTVRTFLSAGQHANVMPHGTLSDEDDDDSLNPSSFPDAKNNMHPHAVNNDNHSGSNQNQNINNRRHSKSQSNIHLHHSSPQSAAIGQHPHQHQHQRHRGDSHSSDTANECTCDPMYSYVARPPAVPSLKQQIKHSNGDHPSSPGTQVNSAVNPSWIQSSIIVDELHRKHANLMQQKHPHASQFLLKTRNTNSSNSHMYNNNKQTQHHHHPHQHQQQQQQHRPPHQRISNKHNGNISHQHGQSNPSQHKLSSPSSRLVTGNSGHGEKIIASFNTSSTSNISNNGQSLRQSNSAAQHMRSAIFWSTNDDRLI